MQKALPTFWGCPLINDFMSVLYYRVEKELVLVLGKMQIELRCNVMNVHG